MFLFAASGCQDYLDSQQAPNIPPPGADAAEVSMTKFTTTDAGHHTPRNHDRMESVYLPLIIRKPFQLKVLTLICPLIFLAAIRSQNNDILHNIIGIETKIIILLIFKFITC
jgi:hypothetical protein